jgi:hypothetical protein
MARMLASDRICVAPCAREMAAFLVGRGADGSRASAGSERPGSTDCEAYHDVIVPSSDSTPPITWDGVWRFGNGYDTLRITSSGSGVTYYYTPGTQVYAVSSGADSEGLRKVTTCNPGYTLTSYRFAWRTQAENFHGGKVTSAMNQIVYP